MSEAKNPVFDKDGKYLYFAASTDSGPSLKPTSAASPAGHPQRLPDGAGEGPASPFAPESDEEKSEKRRTDKKKDDAKKDDKDKDKRQAKTPDVEDRLR